MSDRLGPILITGLLAVLGTAIGGVIEGYFQYSLAREQFRADLIMRALQPDDAEERSASLDFMIDVGLLSDSQIRDGLADRESRHLELPRFSAAEPVTSFGTVVPTTPATAGFTDFGVYICEPLAGRESVRSTARELISSLQRAGPIGSAKLHTWTRKSELSTSELDGKISILLDAGHPEAGELPRIRRAVSELGLSERVVVRDNPGEPSRWFISIVLCIDEGTSAGLPR